MKRFFISAAIVALSLPVAVSAQDLTTGPQVAPVPAAVATTPTPAPLVRSDVAGVQRHESAADAHVVDAVAAAQGMHQGQGVALMVVGGAALVGGLIVGGGAGDAIAVGGLVIGLYGLYQYVR